MLSHRGQVLGRPQLLQCRPGSLADGMLHLFAEGSSPLLRRHCRSGPGLDDHGWTAQTEDHVVENRKVVIPTNGKTCERVFSCFFMTLQTR